MEINYNHKIPDVVTDDIILSGKYGDLDVTGVLNGSVTVKAPAYFILHGIMKGDLLVEEGAHAAIHGVLKADAIQNRGSLDIFGTVTCQSVDLGSVVLHPGCIMNGVKY